MVRAALVSLLGCGASEADGDESGLDAVSLAESPLAVCDGDDASSVAAALAVAAANELGRWDVLSDFQLVNGRLQLSPSGERRCEGWPPDSPGGCENIRAVLALQQDGTAVVPGHDPASLRGKLSAWYESERSVLSASRTPRSRLDEGVFRLRSAETQHYLTLGAGGEVQQAPAGSAVGAAGDWQLVLSGTTHALKNVASGQCLDLAADDRGSAAPVSQACGASATQDLRLLWVAPDSYAITTRRAAHALRASASSGGVTRAPFSLAEVAQRWVIEPSGPGPHEPLDAVLPGVYALGVRHSGRYMAVAGGQMQDSALIQQQSYESWDDRYHWYINHGAAGAAYEVVNRRSGKCLDLETPSNPTTGLLQRRCSGAPTQRFTFRATPDGRYLMLTVYGKAVEIPSASRFAGARFAQGSSASSAAHRQLSLSPIIAGEPHVLTFSNATGDGPCGAYYWYDITQPNGQPLREPAVAFEQLIFAGGKASPTALDANPFLAQQAGGHRVGIAPAYGLNAMPETSAEGCSPACIKFSLQSISGQCCSCNGEIRAYRRSAWSSTTYVCQ